MDIKYLQLEPAAYPADTDWQAMSDAERGCFHSLIVYLSCNDGTLLNDRSILRNLCNSDEETFENFFKKYSHKFIIKDGKLHHKRVDKELKKARKYLKQKSLAGRASGEARRTTVERPLKRPLNGCRTKKRKVKKSKVKNNKLPIFPQIIQSDFEKFWSIYPRKAGKGKARDSFRKISPNSELLEKILKAVEQQKKSEQWEKDNGKYIPNPATWLNQGRWDDELTIKKTRTEILDEKRAAYKKVQEGYKYD